MAPPRTRESATIVVTLDDGVLSITTRAQDEHTLADAQGNVALVHDVIEGSRPPLLLDLRESRAMESEARKYYATHVAEQCCACAVVVKSAFSRTIANFWLGIDKPKVPTRLFTEQDAARLWLIAQRDLKVAPRVGLSA